MATRRWAQKLTALRHSDIVGTPTAFAVWTLVGGNIGATFGSYVNKSDITNVK